MTIDISTLIQIKLEAYESLAHKQDYVLYKISLPEKGYEVFVIYLLPHDEQVITQEVNTFKELVEQNHLFSYWFDTSVNLEPNPFIFTNAEFVVLVSKDLICAHYNLWNSLRKTVENKTVIGADIIEVLDEVLHKRLESKQNFLLELNNK